MSSLVVKGKIAGKRAGVFDGKPFCTLQFLDKFEDGSLRMMDVNLPDGSDHAAYVDGAQVEIPITVRAKDNKVFFRAILPPAGTPRPVDQVNRPHK